MDNLTHPVNTPVTGLRGPGLFGMGTPSAQLLANLDRVRARPNRNNVAAALEASDSDSDSEWQSDSDVEVEEAAFNTSSNALEP
jgi:hypothetical protein